MSDLRPTLESLLAEHGYSKFWREVKLMSRRRLEVRDRPERVHLSKAKRDKLFLRFGGRCNVCGELIDPRTPWQVDHRNPNLTGEEFNAERNLAPAHPSCNASKGAKSISQQSKESGRTYVKLMEDP